MIVADLRHMTGYWDLPGWCLLPLTVVQGAAAPALRGIMWIRAGMWLFERNRRFAAHFCKSRALRVCGAEVHPGARIGPGFALKHSVGIVIGHEVVAGRDLVIHNGVTIGHGGDPGRGQPRIGDGVRIGAGALVLGGVYIGDGAKIGAGAIVLADVPESSTIVGTWRGDRPPARRSGELEA